MADGSADTAHLVGRNGCADPRATNEDAAIRLARDDRLAEAPREIGVVVAGVGAIAAKVHQLVAESRAREVPEELVLEGGPGMIRSEGNAHTHYLSAPHRLRAAVAWGPSAQPAVKVIVPVALSMWIGTFASGTFVGPATAWPPFIGSKATIDPSRNLMSTPGFPVMGSSKEMA